MSIQWYSRDWRRHLMDMHIDDWDDAFLADFSPEQYFAYLKRAKVQSPMIYLQSHAGHCYFPTKVGHMHRSFIGHEDRIRRLIEMCRADGMHVVGYYSLIYNTYEEDRHPEWRIIADGEGRSNRQRGGRYGQCCPNNPEYRAFVTEQLKEIAAYFTLDGMFHDMLFWPARCRCEYCRRRYEQATGRPELPTRTDWHDPAWLDFARLRTEWMGEFAMWATKETKRILGEHITVEHNYANAVAGDWANGATELVNDACEYAGGDLYGDLYNHSFTAKYYYAITKHQPFEYMTVRCDDRLNQHTVNKCDEALSKEVMLTAAHHGASLIIDAIDPAGTMDMRVAERLGRVFERQIPYEPYFSGDMITDVGVFYPTTGRFNPDGQAYSAKTCCVRTVRTLIENHVPVGIVANGYTDRLRQYPFVFAPGVAGMWAADRTAMIDYVREGGTLYFSGAGEPDLIRELLGGSPGGWTQEKRTYIAPLPEYETLFGGFNAAYPLPEEYRLPIVHLTSDEGVLARITLPRTVPGGRDFASIHSDPPMIPTDHPAVVVRRYGAGTVIWSAGPIEEDDRLAYRQIVMSLLRRFYPVERQRVSAEGARQVEIVSFRDGDRIRISAVDLLYSDERLPAPSVRISVQTDNPDAHVRLLPGGERVESSYDDGRISFTLGGFDLFAMAEIVP